jgi:hypothetical protein
MCSNVKHKYYNVRSPRWFVRIDMLLELCIIMVVGICKMCLCYKMYREIVCNYLHISGG